MSKLTVDDDEAPSIEDVEKEAIRRDVLPQKVPRTLTRSIAEGFARALHHRSSRS
jgi:hypothetical protein